MKLTEMLTPGHDWDKEDDERATANRIHALKVQQAIAELDGWELNLVLPKPMNKETGEIFDWTGIAVHEDGNTVPLRIAIWRNKGSSADGNINVTLGSSRVDIDIDSPTETIAKEFKAHYDEMLDEVVELCKLALEDSLLEAIDGILAKTDHEEKNVRIKAKKVVYDPYIADWLSNYKTATIGLVNSPKLAAKLTHKFHDVWLDVLESRLEMLRMDHEGLA
jgi:hypothetical protein